MLAVAGLALSVLTGCEDVATNLATGDSITTGTYEATATVTYTWQVEYAESFDQGPHHSPRTVCVQLSGQPQRH